MGIWIVAILINRDTRDAISQPANAFRIRCRLEGSVQFLSAVMVVLIDWDQRVANVHSSAKIRRDAASCGAWSASRVRVSS